MSAEPVPASSDAPRLLPRRQYRPWVSRLLLFGACVVGVDGLVGDRGLSETLKARRDLQRASTELTALRNQNEHLRREALRFRHDLRSIEELARRELGLLKRGEILVIVKDLPQ